MKRKLVLSAAAPAPATLLGTVTVGAANAGPERGRGGVSGIRTTGLDGGPVTVGAPARGDRRRRRCSRCNSGTPADPEDPHSRSLGGLG
jgi:hypothetical protein